LLVIDGIKVGFHFLKQVAEQQNDCNEFGYDSLNEYHPINIQEGDRIVGIDPNRSSLFSAAWGDEERDVLNFSSRQWLELSGVTYCNKKHEVWNRGDTLIHSLVLAIPTACCWESSSYNLRLRHYLLYKGAIVSYYRPKRWRRMRWKTRIKRQKAYDSICKTIAGGENPERVVVVYGGASFNPCSRGHPPTPNKHLYKEIKKRFRSRLINEYNTSKLCSKCDNILVQSDIWSIKSCNNPNCWTRWNRDVNAARNIRRVFLHMNANGGERPEAFRRRN
jgi:hypothetical protein